jgi:cobalamin 5'-phosphate synthase/cobalamin synthase
MDDQKAENPIESEIAANDATATAEDSPAKSISIFLRLIAATAFLTRLPMPRGLRFGAADVGRSTVFFPLVGALIGVLQAVAYLFFQTAARDDVWRSSLTAILLVAVGVFATGALHLDGLADMADGFGGGRDKESALKIMRDSVIGSYGAIALILLLLLKTTAIAALTFEFKLTAFLILAPALGRWTTVWLGKFMPYARKTGGLGKSITDFVGWTELVGASVIAAALSFGLLEWRQVFAVWVVIAALTAFNAYLCRGKIGGITGDTLGANTEICETAVFVTAVFLKL